MRSDLVRCVQSRRPNRHPGAEQRIQALIGLSDTGVWEGQRCFAECLVRARVPIAAIVIVLASLTFTGAGPETVTVGANEAATALEFIVAAVLVSSHAETGGVIAHGFETNESRAAIRVFVHDIARIAEHSTCAIDLVTNPLEAARAFWTARVRILFVDTALNVAAEPRTADAFTAIVVHIARVAFVDAILRSHGRVPAKHGHPGGNDAEQSAQDPTPGSSNSDKSREIVELLLVHPLLASFLSPLTALHARSQGRAS